MKRPLTMMWAVAVLLTMASACATKDWKNAWKDISIRLMKQFGMNTLGNWSDHELYGLMPYVTMLERFPETKHTIFRDFPDVLSPEYAADAVACAASLKGKNMDPSMIGYFMRNEPGWAFVDGLVIADEVLRDPEETYCKRGLISFLKEKYVEINQLNEAWNSDFDDFIDLTHPIAQASKLSTQAECDLRAFSASLIEAYVSIPARECRKADPNHMNLGMRWAWISDPSLVSGWKYNMKSLSFYQHATLWPNSSGGYTDIEDISYNEIVEKKNKQADLIALDFLNELKSGSLMIEKKEMNILFQTIEKECRYNYASFKERVLQFKN